MKKRFLAIFFFGVSAMLAAQGTSLRERLADPAWENSYQAALERLTLGENIAGRTFMLIRRILSGEEAPPDPVLAARHAARLAGDLDEDLRRGIPAASAVSAYRHSWRNAAAYRVVRQKLKIRGMASAAGTGAGRPGLPGPRTAGPRWELFSAAGE